MLGTTFSVPWVYSLPSVVEVTGLRLISGMALASIPCLAYGREACIEVFFERNGGNSFGEHFVYTRLLSEIEVMRLEDFPRKSIYFILFILYY